jgi:hypothetical protein
MHRRRLLQNLVALPALAATASCVRGAGESDTNVLPSSQPTGVQPPSLKPTNASGIDDVTSRQQRWPVKSLTSYTTKDAHALPAMPARPTLADFIRHRFLLSQHLLYAGKWALDQGLPEPVALACLLHDCGHNIARPDHGFWAAQLIRPYVTEEVAWAIEAHQALRWFAEPAVGYKGAPEFYKTYFPNGTPPDIQAQYKQVRKHKWYGSARLITMADQETPAPKALYVGDKPHTILDADIFTDLIGRNFKQPKEGLGNDGSPVAHMWRTMIEPQRML